MIRVLPCVPFTIAWQVDQLQAGAKRRRDFNKKLSIVSEETSDILLAGYAKEIE